MTGAFLSSEIRLMSSLATSIFLYACESWTLIAKLQRRVRAVEMKCYHKILRISYTDNVHHYYHHHLSLNREGRSGATDDSQPVFSIFLVLHFPLGLGELKACPFPNVVFSLFPLSASSSCPFYCALQDGFGQT